MLTGPVIAAIPALAAGLAILATPLTLARRARLEHQGDLDPDVQAWRRLTADVREARAAGQWRNHVRVLPPDRTERGCIG